MPDVLVTQCAGCHTFQGQLEKKSNKWKCSICNAKQTLQRVHARGTGPEMRKVVQNLNRLRLEGDATVLNSLHEKHISGGDLNGDYNTQNNCNFDIPKIEWNAYISSDDDQADDCNIKRHFEEEEVERLATCSTSTKWKRLKSINHQTPCHSPNSSPCVDPVVEYVEQPQLKKPLPKWKHRRANNSSLKPFPFVPPSTSNQTASPALSMVSLSQNLPVTDTNECDDEPAVPSVWDQYL